MQASQEFTHPVARLAAEVEAERRRRLRIDAQRIRDEIAAGVRVEQMRARGVKVQSDLTPVEVLRAQLAEVDKEIAAIDAALAAREAEARAKAQAIARATAQVAEEASQRAKKALLQARMAFDSAQAQRLQAALAGDTGAYADACAASDEAHAAYRRAQQAAEG